MHGFSFSENRDDTIVLLKTRGSGHGQDARGTKEGEGEAADA